MNEEVKPETLCKIGQLIIEYYDRKAKYAEEIFEITMEPLKIRIIKHGDGKYDVYIKNIHRLTVEVTSYQFPEIV